MIQQRNAVEIARDRGIPHKIGKGGELILYDSRGKPYVYVAPRGGKVTAVTYEGRGRHRAAMSAGAVQETTGHRNNPRTGFRAVTFVEPTSAQQWLDLDLARLATGRADRTSD